MDLNGLPHRRTIRLPKFDYTQHHAYFVTLCTTQRLCLFGEVENGAIQLSAVGQVVETAWQDLPCHTLGLVLDSCVVMLNHLHGILILPGAEATRSPKNGKSRSLKSGSLGTIIGGFKSAVSREVNTKHLTLVRPLWQRNYYERIIRNDRELNHTRQYILDNPSRWNDDPDHPRQQNPLPSPHRL